jgi:nucleoside-diphosphate-sugar epimerase
MSSPTPRAVAGRVRRRVARAAAGRRPVSPWPQGPGHRVVVTGAAGRIGQVLLSGLAGEAVLRGVDLVPGAGVDVVADLRKLRRVEDAFAGADAVVDLAAVPSVAAPWPTVLGNNIPVSVNVLEAARRAGVPRVIFASSNHVTGLFEKDAPYAAVLDGDYEGLEPSRLPRIGVDAPLRPDSFYAIGKILGEAAARYYAETHGLSVVCLRLGYVAQDDRPHNAEQEAKILYHRDLVDLIRRCLDAPGSARFGIFYGVSANRWRIWDYREAVDELGYDPT